MKRAVLRRVACAGLALLPAAALAEVRPLPHAEACFSHYDLVAYHPIYGSVPARIQPAQAQFVTLSLAPNWQADMNQAPVRFYVIASCEPHKVQFAVTSIVDGARHSRSLYVDAQGKADWSDGPVSFSISEVRPRLHAQSPEPGLSGGASP